MSTLGSLVIQLQADLARLNSDMNKAVGIVDGAMASIRNAAGIAKSALGGLAVGLVGGLGAGALTSSIKAVVDYGDRLNDVSKATGASVEQLSFLDYAAKQSGTSLEGITGSIGKLQKNLVEVANGGGKAAAKALDTLGISSKQLLQVDLVTQLSTLADALGQVKNPSERAAIANAIFGKSARDILPLLADGSAGVRGLADEFRALGAVVTKEEAEKFDALNDAIGKFQTAAAGTAKTITSELAPSLTKMFESLAKGVAQGDGKSGFEKWSDSLRLWTAELKVTIAEANLATQSGFVDKLASAFGGSAKQRIDKARRELEAARAALATTKSDIFSYKPGDSASGTLGGGVTPLPAGTGATDAQLKEAKRLLESQDKYLDGLKAQFVAQTNNTQLAKVYSDIANGDAAKFTKETQDTAVALATQLDLLKDQKALLDESAEVHQYLNGIVRERAQLEEKADQDLAKRRQTIIENLQTPLEKYVETVKELTDPRFGFNSDQIARGIKDARDTMIDAQRKAEGLTDTARELGLTFTSAAEDAFVKWEGFGNLLEGISQDILRLFVRTQITDPFIKAFAPEGGGGLFDQGVNWFKGLFANASGGLYKVGGSGSEHPVAFTARAGEYVAVGTRMAGAGGSEAPVVNVYNQAGAAVSARRGADGRTIEVFVTSAVERNISRGGSRLGKPPIATR